MCGIVGVFNNIKDNVLDDIIFGLKRLEYRGYDSSGVALNGNDGFSYEKSKGKIVELENKIQNHKMLGFVGIGHTRWATHGGADVKNAHPIVTEHVALVHNGIIENYAELKRELDCTFTTDTDTEVVARLLDRELNNGSDIKTAVFNVVAKLKGAYSILILFKNFNNILVGIKNKSPMVFGIAKNKYYICSDVLAFGVDCQDVVYMDDGDLVFIENGLAQFYQNTKKIEKVSEKLQSVNLLVDKNGYKHFMLKEIFEQVSVIASTISLYSVTNFKDDFSKYSDFLIIACGSSFYVGLIAKYWFEEFLDIRVSVEIASEFTYRKPVILKDTLVIAISQSGETADTINAVNYIKKLGNKIISIVNVKDSTISRMADRNFMTFAGPEIGVASTKAFTAQMMLFAMIVVNLVKDQTLKNELEKCVMHLPASLSVIFDLNQEIQDLADKFFVHSKNALIIGRGNLYPIALEGALKLKEVSYIHAEGYAAGELKHGPIALVDEKMPVIVLGDSSSGVFCKLKSNLENVRARNGCVFFFTDDASDYNECENVKIIKMPKTHRFITPLMYVIPLQLLAYYTALAKGTDIDQPRNLAKSVTVE